MTETGAGSVVRRVSAVSCAASADSQEVGGAVPTAMHTVLAGSSRKDGDSVSSGADLRSEPYADRIGRWALDALQRLLNTGHCEVADADLSNSCGATPHAKLPLAPSQWSGPHCRLG